MEAFKRPSLLELRGVRYAVVFLVALAFRLWFLHWPLIEDEAAYAYVARWWLDGQALYGPYLWLDRPQAIFLAYLPPVIAGGSPWLLRVWGALWAAGTAVAVVRVAESFGSVRAGLIAGLVFATLSCSPFVEGWTGNAEWFMVLPATVAVEMLSRNRAGWAGALTALAVLLKPSAVPMILLFPLFLRGWMALGRSLAAATFVTLPFVLHGWWTAGFGGYFHALLGARVAAWGAFDLPHLPPLASALVTSPAWLGLLLIGAPVLKGRWPLVAWLAVAALGVAIGGQYYPHYYIQVFPPLAVATGLALAARGVSPLALVAAAWTVVLFVVAVRQPAAWWEDRDVIAPAVAAFVRSESNPDDTVYVAFSAANILYLSNRRSAHPHVYPLHVMSIPGSREELLSRLRAREPRYVIHVDRMVRRRPNPWRVFTDASFEDTLRANYDLVASIATVPIYDRKTTAVEARKALPR